MAFETKDSGERQEFSTGMRRDVQTDKPRYDLLDKPMLKRWAELMGRGAAKYGEDNWKKSRDGRRIEAVSGWRAYFGTHSNFLKVTERKTTPPRFVLTPPVTRWFWLRSPLN